MIKTLGYLDDVWMLSIVDDHVISDYADEPLGPAWQQFLKNHPEVSPEVRDDLLPLLKDRKIRTKTTGIKLNREAFQSESELLMAIGDSPMANEALALLDGDKGIIQNRRDMKIIDLANDGRTPVLFKRHQPSTKAFTYLQITLPADNTAIDDFLRRSDRFGLTDDAYVTKATRDGIQYQIFMPGLVQNAIERTHSRIKAIGPVIGIPIRISRKAEIVSAKVAEVEAEIVEFLNRYGFRIVHENITHGPRVLRPNNGEQAVAMETVIRAYVKTRRNLGHCRNPDRSLEDQVRKRMRDTVHESRHDIVEAVLQEMMGSDYTGRPITYDF